MNRLDIIRMAREAEIPGSWDLNWFDPYLERFAALVATAKQEEIVLECAQLVKDNIDPHNAWITPGDIKLHFGIKS